ncbi:hypothetical protein ACTVJH_14905 [Desulfoplanes sp. PS50]
MKYLWIMLLIISGCAPMQNLSVADVRNDSHLRHSGVIQMSIEKAAECAETTNYVCGPGGSAMIVKNPDGSGKFSMFIYSMGWTQSNPYVIIDFDIGENETTKYKGYTAMVTWSSSVLAQIRRIKACGDCNKLK